MPGESEQIIARLQLSQKHHGEDVYFREIIRSPDSIVPPERYSDQNPRPASTCIYYLMKKGAISWFHKLQSDETWQYISGGSLTLYIIEEDGTLNRVKLDKTLSDEQGAVLQYTVKHGLWFAAKPNSEYTLVTCTDSPGFDPTLDRVQATKEDLLALYEEKPGLRDAIFQFTKGRPFSKHQSYASIVAATATPAASAAAAIPAVPPTASTTAIISTGSKATGSKTTGGSHVLDDKTNGHGPSHRYSRF